MTDVVNHPSHYAEGWSNGAEVIDITENLNFNRGNAVKYIARAGAKDPDKEIEDLQKSVWYIEREIARVQFKVGVVDLDAAANYTVQSPLTVNGKPAGPDLNNYLEFGVGDIVRIDQDYGNGAVEAVRLEDNLYQTIDRTSLKLTEAV